MRWRRHPKKRMKMPVRFGGFHSTLARAMCGQCQSGWLPTATVFVASCTFLSLTVIFQKERLTLADGVTVVSICVTSLLISPCGSTRPRSGTITLLPAFPFRCRSCHYLAYKVSLPMFSGHLHRHLPPNPSNLPPSSLKSHLYPPPPEHDLQESYSIWTQQRLRCSYLQILKSHLLLYRTCLRQRWPCAVCHSL